MFSFLKAIVDFVLSNPQIDSFEKKVLDQYESMEKQGAAKCNTCTDKPGVSQSETV